MSEFVKLIITIVFCGIIYAMYHFGLWEYSKVLFIVISLAMIGIGFKLWLD